jgi:sugar phosphate isomerase/epimerase
MVNQGTLAPEVRQQAIDALRKINAYAKQKNVFVTMENRGYGAPGNRTVATTAPAPPTPPSWDVVVEVIRAAGIRANPDVGNFPDEETRAQGLRAMYPLSSGSSHCHYNPERYDEARALRIAKEVGYRGLFSIEAASNNGPDPYAAVQTILDELLKDI